MSQNYLQFSEVIEKITPDELAWWIAEAERVAKAWNEDDDAHEDIENCNDFEVDYRLSKHDSVWFHSDESGDVDKVAHIVQRFLKEFRPDECFTMTWANHCSKLAVGEFGGGAVFVTAKYQKFYSGHTWINEQHATWKEEGQAALDNPDSA